MKIVILDGHALNPGDLSWDCIRQFGDVTYYDRTPKDLVVQRIEDAEVILLNKVQITEEILAQCPNLRLICILATGYNVVDCDAAAKRGIRVCNVPGYSTNSVAQFTFALLLELCHQVSLHSQSVHNGEWTACPDFCYWKTPQLELYGKTLGIIGYGSIGRAVATIAQAFGLHVLVYNRTKRNDAQYVSLEELLQQSDIVTLHCPLFPENTGMINSSTIAQMKDGAILINTARGGLIDEIAVADALHSGKLSGAAMDVVCMEPINEDSPLLAAPNCIITPHIAWAPKEARQRILDITMQSISGYLSGKFVNVVNM